MRAKPVVVGCRLTVEKKRRFYEKVRSEGKTPQDVLEELVDGYLKS
jgi:hypothetical protein